MKSDQSPESAAAPSLKRRVAYSLAAGVAAAGSTGAETEAAIVYTNPPDVNVNVGFGYSVDFDGASPVFYDVRLKNLNLSGNRSYQGLDVLGYGGRAVGTLNGGFGYIAALTSGTSIGPASNPYLFGGTLAIAGSAVDKFEDVDNAYIGIKFPIFANFYYGWIRVSVDNAARQLTIHDWAYEDSGRGIGAGTIPEPGTLGMLAAGALGLAALRRKREQAAA